MSRTVKKRLSEFGIKNASSKIGQNIVMVLPMIEEITKGNVMPLCLIGFSTDEKTGKISAFLSTISDEEQFEICLYEICKQFIEHRKDKYEPAQPT